MTNIKWSDGKYIIEINETLEYDERDITKVQEKFNIDMLYNFAEAIKNACLMNGLINKNK